MDDARKVFDEAGWDGSGPIDDVEILLGTTLPNNPSPVLKPAVSAKPNKAGEARKGVIEADGTEFVVDPIGSGGLIGVVLLGARLEADKAVDEVLGEDSF